VKVSFIVVAYNAGSKLENLLEDLKKQDYNHNDIEIILVDSNSSDNTKDIMMKFKEINKTFSKVLVLDNPKKILPCGWNIALEASTGDLILRVDAHSSLPNDFISKNVNRIDMGEKIVGGHRISIIDENNAWQKTLLIAEKSIFGSGIATYRRKEREEYVSTLAHAAYSREVFKKVGGYDERLARTEDNEIHYRMKKAGYKFLLDPTIKSYHHARNSLSKMMKQKYLNGYWIGLTMGISPKCFSIYHFVPLVFVLALIFSIIFAFVFSGIPLILLLGAYFTFNILNTIFSIISEKKHLDYLLLPFIFFLLHLSYGWGTLYGLIKLPFWIRLNKSFEYPIVK
jgi:GT2 family glycosyltransferase